MKTQRLLLLAMIFFISLMVKAQRDTILYASDSTYSIRAKEYDDHAELTKFQVHFKNITHSHDWAFHSEVQLPSHIDNTPVTIIGEAFCGGSMGHSGGHITPTFIIPHTVIEIKPFAFANTYMQTLFHEAHSLKKIGTSAFQFSEFFGNSDRGYKLYPTLKLPEGVEEIGEFCFASTQISELTLPKKLKRINSSSFRYCNKLRSVDFPDSLEFIGDNAFEGSFDFALSAQGSSSINLPSLKHIGARAFAETKITSFSTGDSLSYIGKSCFYNCDCLGTVLLPNTLEQISEQAFYGCSNLAPYQSWWDETKTGFKLPDSLKTIGANAFEGCEELEISIPKTVIEIRQGAFKNSGVTSADLSGTAGSWPSMLGSEAFYGCKKLRSVKFSPLCESIPSRAFYGSGLTQIDIPDGVTRIGSQAFYLCAFTELDLPDSLRILEDEAITGCRARTIVIPPLVTHIGKNNFDFGSNHFSTCLEYIILECNDFIDLAGTIPGNFFHNTLYPNHMLAPLDYVEQYDSITYKLIRGTITGYEKQAIKNIIPNQYYALVNRNNGKYLLLSGSGINESAFVSKEDMKYSAGAQIRLIESGTIGKYYMGVQGIDNPLLASISFKGNNSPIEHPAFWRWNVMVDGKYLASDNKGNFTVTDSANINADWYIVPTEELNIKMLDGNDGKSYAAIFLPFDVQATDSTKIYVASSLNEGNVVLEEVENGKLKANKGALVVNNEGQKSVTLQIATKALTPKTNLFAGSLVDAYDATMLDKAFILNYSPEYGIGFYTPEIPVMKANTAYLPRTEPVQDLDFIGLEFRQEISSIDSLPSYIYKKQDTTYDLQGRKVSGKLKKGIYVRNGRKIFVK